MGLENDYVSPLVSGRHKPERTAPDCVRGERRGMDEPWDDAQEWRNAVFGPDMQAALDRLAAEQEGWANPISPHGEKLVMVLDSCGLHPERVPKVFRSANCFSCDKELDGEGVLLSFAEEGPWMFCRSCVRETTMAFKFVADCDW